MTSSASAIYVALRVRAGWTGWWSVPIQSDAELIDLRYFLRLPVEPGHYECAAGQECEVVGSFDVPDANLEVVPGVVDFERVGENVRLSVDFSTPELLFVIDPVTVRPDKPGFVLRLTHELCAKSPTLAAWKADALVP